MSNKSAQEARYHESANDMCYLILPVVPHKAVAEVSKIGNL